MLAMLAFAACSSNQDDAVGEHQVWHVTIQASIDGADTRALTEGAGNSITASFAAGDKVVVVGADGTTVGTLTASTAGASTTLSGTISGVSVNQELTFRYRSATANYDGQVGTLDGIATSQDCAEGTLTVTATDPSLTLSSNMVTLAAKQSITKFSFTCGENSVNVKAFGIAATGLVKSISADGTETVGAVTGTLTTAASDVYVALRNNSGEKQTYSFYVKNQYDEWYTGTKKANLANGKNYTATVNLTQLPTLTTSSAVGTIGVVGGRPAIAISSSKAIALVNDGALCPEAYGTYYAFDSGWADPTANTWYVPSKAEMDDLATKTNAWVTQNGVKGRTFTIGSNTLFLPAAGFNDNYYNNGLKSVTTDGYYWTATSIDDNTAYYFDVDNAAATSLSDYKVDALTVRRFHSITSY